MMITGDKVTEIFCMADDFCKIFDRFIKVNGLGPKRDNKKRRYHRAGTMSSAEVITIMILFHLSGYKCLKHFYVNEVKENMTDLFPATVSYNRFTELERGVIVPFVLFVKKCCMGMCTGISFVDSTALRVCKNQRIHFHRVFRGIAQRGQCSMGWFYGFKLHLICNEKGDLLSFMLTPGNVDDREPLKNKSFVEQIFGKIVGDKGYISKELFGRLFVDGIQLVTRLKNMTQIEHSRHRSVANFAVNLMAGLAAYSFFPKKPMIALERVSPMKGAVYNWKSFRYNSSNPR